jgi:CDP-diacylglycerol--serine O-phosphatidyltransferase
MTPRLLPKPKALADLESRIGRAIPVHPHVLSIAKLALLPALAAALGSVPGVLAAPMLAAALLVCVFALDYLDGAVAREQGLCTNAGRFLDRLTDWPLLALVAARCLEVLPTELVIARLSLDALLLLLYLRGRGSTENRLRTLLSYATLLSLLALTFDLLPALFTPGLARGLLGASVVLSAVVGLRNAGLLRLSRLADGLSLANLACGVAAIAFAAQGRFELGLPLLFLSAILDGADGAAARRFGGSRFGVYADDLGDFTSYGLAPGAALAFAVGGAAGVALGGLYAAFTLARLIFFTRRKSETDPARFEGAPSTLGAALVWSAIVAFPGEPALHGAVGGVAALLMVSFPYSYAHFGRSLGPYVSRAIFIGALTLSAVVSSWRLLGPQASALALLLAALVWGLWPHAKRFARGVR